MGTRVSVPLSLDRTVYQVLNKMSNAIAGNARIYSKVQGTLEDAVGAATSNSATFVEEAQYVVDTDYVPLEGDRETLQWEAKVIDLEGTFNGTDTEVFADCTAFVSPQSDTVKILVKLMGLNLTSFSNLSGTWVLQEIK